MTQDEQLHEQILRAFNEYYKANQRWLSKGTRRAGMDTRYWLGQIRILARERRKLIQEWRHEVDERKAARKAQNDSSEDQTNTN